MRKLTAMVCVLGWSAFWVFGFLALSSDGSAAELSVLSIVVAGLGFLTGAFAYMQLSRDMPLQYMRAFQHD